MIQSLIRPAVGSIFSEERRRIRSFQDHVLFANSDLSGISIFEEAQDHGVEAAQRVLSRLSGQPQVLTRPSRILHCNFGLAADSYSLGPRNPFALNRIPETVPLSFSSHARKSGRIVRTALFLGGARC